MDGYREGEIITLRFDDDKFIPGKILQIEPLTLHDIVHVRLYDILVEGGPGGYDPAGDYRARSHNLSENITARDPLFDSLAMTSTAFEESDPVPVAFEEIRDEEMTGYTVWVAQRRAAAEQKGMIRYDVEEESEEEEIDGGKEDESRESGTAGAGEDAAGEGDSSDEGRVIEIEVRPWHRQVYDIPLPSILRDLSEILTDEPYASSEVGQRLIRQREEGSSEIGNLVQRLVVDGDYAAGQELLDFGDRAVPALSGALATAEETQTVEDLCQILADMGSDDAYDALSHGMESRLGRLNESESARAAARSWLYAVMLTGGSPEPLRRRLALIEQMDHPELKDDVDAALEAVKAGGAEVPTGQKERSSDPFGM